LSPNFFSPEAGPTETFFLVFKILLFSLSVCYIFTGKNKLIMISEEKKEKSFYGIGYFLFCFCFRIVVKSYNKK